MLVSIALSREEHVRAGRDFQGPRGPSVGRNPFRPQDANPRTFHLKAAELTSSGWSPFLGRMPLTMRKLLLMLSQNLFPMAACQWPCLCPSTLCIRGKICSPPTIPPEKNGEVNSGSAT